MPHLSDTQRILLSSASQREGGSVLPLPPYLKPGAGTNKALDALANRGLTEERETSDASAVRLTDGDLRLGLFITAAGLAAIGAQPESGSGEPVIEPVTAPAAKTSKTAAVLVLPSRPSGATLAEMIAATGWLPHTTRAALTGLRKKGHALERSKRDQATCYRLVSGS